VLGVLLTAVSLALARVNTVELDALPRMADFAVWAAAAAPALGWEAKVFLDAYTENREAANELTLEASSIAPFISHKADIGFTGTATQLLREITLLAAEDIKRQKSWPKHERSLSNALCRIAPNLRATGIDVDFRREPGGSRQRVITIMRTTG
jgi:putative DNA primase/helicase